ncbi:MBL fold metallo-hydrolase [candidate division KSB1 bacterium]|nr:MBL fold metallo-hydrolase [candidate division KSB1 bacterium]
MDVENIFWYGHDSFRIDDKDKTIYIDPWKLPADAPKADYIFITHDHYDHFSSDDIIRLSKHVTRIFCPRDVFKKVGESATALAPGEKIVVDELKVEAVPAYNIDKKFHPKENNWLGFIITLSDNTRVYHAGDTDFIPEMSGFQTDVALLPVSGTYVMTASEAVEAANVIKPEIAIPMHYGDIVGDDNDALKFKQGFSGETVIKSPLK